MKIGIAGPVSVKTLQHYLNDLSTKDLELGSGCSAINYIIIGLLRRGYSVSAYTLDSNLRDEPQRVLKGNNLTVFIGKHRAYKRIHQLKYLDFQRYESNQIKNFIESDNPDVVNAHWSYEYAIGAIRSKHPHLITFRDDAITVFKMLPKPYRLIRLLMDVWVKKNGDYFNVNSPYLQNSLSNWKPNIPIIPNSYRPDIPFGIPKKLSSNEIKIVSILTGWGKTKNPESGIRAFDILKKLLPNIHIEYHIFGNGYEIDSPGNKWCIDNNLCEDIHFHGFIHHNALMEKLTDFDIFLHPARVESFGNSIVEALGKGLPVVAGKNSGAVPWLLGFGKYGILTDITDPVEIASELKHIIQNKTLYESFSKVGIEYVREKFSNEIITNKYIEYYKKIKRDSKSPTIS